MMVVPTPCGSSTVLNPSPGFHVKPCVMAVLPVPTAVRHGRAAGADGVGAHGLVGVVDAERLGHRGAGNGELGEAAVGGDDERVSHAAGVGVEPGHVTEVIDRGGGQARARLAARCAGLHNPAEMAGGDVVLVTRLLPWALT